MHFTIIFNGRQANDAVTSEAYFRAMEGPAILRDSSQDDTFGRIILSSANLSAKPSIFKTA